MTDREYLKLKELGELFNTTSHKVGRWLMTLEYRTKGQPSCKAFRDGLVGRKDYDGHPHWLWHRERTVAALENAGHRLAAVPPNATSVLKGPFSVRKLENERFEIVSDDGSAAVTVWGEENAVFIAKVLNYCNDRQMFPRTSFRTRIY